jgi:hypothetical protein
MAGQTGVKVRQMATRKSGKSGVRAARIENFVELGPEQTIQQMAARHRARIAADAAEGQPFVEVDVPFVDDGANW